MFWNASHATFTTWVLLLSSEKALGVFLTSYVQEQFWMLEEGAHFFWFP